MFHGYNWQTRTLEVRPDRIPPDFDGSNPTLISPGGFHSPGNLVLFLLAWDRASDYVAGPVFPGLPSQSIPAVPTIPEDFLALSRPPTAAASRNLFVGNVGVSPFYSDTNQTFFTAPLPLPMARLEGPFQAGGDDTAGGCCSWT